MTYDRENPDHIWGNTVPEFWTEHKAARGKELFAEQENKYGCPFAWLLGHV